MRPGSLVSLLGLLAVVLMLPSHLESIDLNQRGRSSSRRRNSYGRDNKAAEKTKVGVAVVLPHSMFKEREYRKKIYQATQALSGSKFSSNFEISPYLEMLQPIPAPTEVLDKICKHFLANNTAILVYLSDR